MINEKVINKIKYYLLILFVVIQPVLDIHYLYTEEVVNAIGFSPSTIIRIGIVAILGVLTILTVKDKKAWIFISIYLLLVGIYTILHLLNSRDFYTLVPNDLGYSVVGEIFYIIRMLIPIAIIFITMTTDISNKDYEKAIKIILLIISLSIILTNIFKVSLESYGTDIISGNIFDWFNNGYEKYNYIQLASRGPFNAANQISALLILLLPIMFAIYTYDKTKINLFTILSTILSMIMIGTKVALYGAIIVVIIYSIMLVVVKILKKDIIIDKKIFTIIALSILLIGGLYSKSPSINRGVVESGYKSNAEKEEAKKENIKEQENISQEINQDNKNNINKDANQISTNEEMIQYVEENFMEAKIKYDFITKHYPYKYDPEFWIEIMELPVQERTNYRFLELKMHQRVKELNNNPADNWLGIGFTRSEHLFTLERDFIAQYYSIGIIGSFLLLGPYILAIIVCFVKMILEFRKKFNITNLITCFAIVFILAASVNSGNVMDCLTIMIILGFIIGKLIEDIFIKE